VTVFEKTNPARYRPADSYGVALVAVRIDPADVKLPTWEDIIASETGF
jgi:hypothetical protein